MSQAPESPYFLKINSLSSRSQRIKDFALAAIQIASWWWRIFSIRKYTWNCLSTFTAFKTHLHHQRPDSADFHNSTTNWDQFVCKTPKDYKTSKWLFFLYNV